MKKNFDALKAVRTVQGADGNGGHGGNVNPSNQDQDSNSMTGVMGTGYQKAAESSMNFDGGVGHDYTSHN